MLILSRKDMIEMVTNNSQKYAVIAIYEFDMMHQVRHIEPHCQSLLLEFDDITSDKPRAPKFEQVQQALEWAKDKDKENLIVACAQGVSRSAALGFLIECQTKTPLEAASNLWQTNKHYPNELILKYGCELMGDHLKPVIQAYYKALGMQRGWKPQFLTKFFR